MGHLIRTWYGAGLIIDITRIAGMNWQRCLVLHRLCLLAQRGGQKQRF